MAGMVGQSGPQGNELVGVAMDEIDIDKIRLRKLR